MKSLIHTLFESSNSLDKGFAELESSAQDIIQAYIRKHKPTDTIRDCVDYVHGVFIDIVTRAANGDISAEEIKNLTKQYYKEIITQIESEGFDLDDKFDNYLRAMRLNEGLLDRKRTSDKLKSDRSSDRSLSTNSVEMMKTHPNAKNREKFDLEDHPAVAALAVCGSLFGGGALFISVMYWLATLCV